MSSDESDSVPATSDRREAVREKALQVQAKQSRARLIRTAAIAAAIVAIVAVTAVVVTWTVGSAASKPLLDPANVNGDGIIVTSVTGTTLEDGSSEMGNAAPAAPTEPATPTETPTPDPSATAQPAVDIRVYVDYLSPGSRDFQLANAPQLSAWVTQGAATLSYYPVAMLTSKSNGTKYSLRAASAAACVATHSPDTFFAFTHTLLDQQPAVDSDGFSDEELATIAQAAGASSPKVVRACIEDEDFASWAKSATDRALVSIPDTDGTALTGTPMVLVNGTQYVGALDDPAEFSQFVLTIASDSYYRTASPTPTPTPTP
ncbi:thioredoxin domain-containing protein [Microbacterium sp. SS28]|uniref:DsbA family protein n=1 Tax=Microbacterium sp. SS28 TaxID=2919948 RepID=UPI001FA9AC3A|nr:thioredoxin domain-containing protein [Microbacterium sp. SS28]